MSETKRKHSLVETNSYTPPETLIPPVMQNGAGGFHHAPPPYSANGIETEPAQGEVSREMLSTAEALTQLTRSVTPTNPPPPSVSNIASPMSSLTIEESGFPHELPPLLPSPHQQHPLVTKVNQVSRHPIVTNAFKYYESSKRAYPHFNYAAEFVERAAIPVVSKIESNLNSRHIKQMEQKSQDELAGPTRKRKRTNSITDKAETKKRLQFCLHILRLANDQINNKVHFLQQKISEREIAHDHDVDQSQDLIEVDDTPQDEKFHTQSKSVVSSPGTADTLINEGQTEVAQQATTEIITTVKKIIHVISNFKTSSLLPISSPALTPSSSNEENQELKSTIRDIILKLPNQIQQAANASSSQQTNDRIFVFAKESLDMIGRLTKVFNDQLEKAEVWIAGDDEVSETTSITEKTAIPANS